MALKVTTSGGAVTSAIDVLYSPTDQNVQVWTVENGWSWVQKGSYPVSMNPGDQLGARATADGQVRVYQNGSLLTSVDLTDWAYYMDGGAIGVWMVNAGAARLDDFGGGVRSVGYAPEGFLTGVPLYGLRINK